MPSGQVIMGMVSVRGKKKDPQTQSGFDYAANSLPTSADTQADFTLILLIERNVHMHNPCCLAHTRPSLTDQYFSNFRHIL